MPEHYDVESLLHLDTELDTISVKAFVPIQNGDRTPHGFISIAGMEASNGPNISTPESLAALIRALKQAQARMRDADFNSHPNI